MITVRLCGGLGNQMFQYAAGLSLAERENTSLRLDISAFKFEKRSYSLSAFGITESVFDSDIILKGLKKFTLVKKAFSLYDRSRFFISKRVPLKIARYFREKQGYVFDTDFLGLGNIVTLDGYWQTEKYFLPIADQIRKIFHVEGQFSPQDREIVSQLAGHTSVSLHVRRGDYVANPIFNQVHGICSIAYYKEAIRKVESQVGPVRYVIFSDDPDWCRDQFAYLEDKIFVTHNLGERSHLDLGLMSACNHHVIANSSFSWWGAWLNPKADKIVICPRQWLTTSTVDNWDLIPTNWDRI